MKLLSAAWFVLISATRNGMGLTKAAPVDADAMDPNELKSTSIRGGTNFASSDPKSMETAELLQLVSDLAAEVQSLKDERSARKNLIKDLDAALDVQVGAEPDDEDVEGSGAARLLKSDCLLASLYADSLNFASYYTCLEVNWNSGCDKCFRGYDSKAAVKVIPGINVVRYWSVCD
eukprot:CCRYP_007490-RA/>CCRYP_007490-RA protein AED:0.03 eAED:0.03 QI:156/1/1/1/1/1/2/503/175